MYMFVVSVYRCVCMCMPVRRLCVQVYLSVYFVYIKKEALKASAEFELDDVVWLPRGLEGAPQAATTSGDKPPLLSKSDTQVRKHVGI